MALFNFFGKGEHRVFNYKPIYYDPEKEEMKRKFGAVDGSMAREKKDGSYVPGSYIKGSLRSGAYSKERGHLQKASVIMGIISLILAFAVVFLLAKAIVYFY